MRLVIDTHVLIWLARTSGKMSAASRDLLSRPSTVTFVSSVTLWELRLKWNSRSRLARDELLDPLEAIPFATAAGFELAALTPGDCVVSLEPPLGHRDPFDEQLLIHAQQLGAKLLTGDRRLAGHPLALSIA